MSWTIKKATLALRKGTHSRNYLAKRVNLSASALYYRAFPEKLKSEPSRKGTGRKSRRGSKVQRSTKRIRATLKRFVQANAEAVKRLTAAEALAGRLALYLDRSDRIRVK